jgi:hypothetical protein
MASSDALADALAGIAHENSSATLGVLAATPRQHLDLQGVTLGVGLEE